jgi:FHS family L-fucose permease-like MFS transporter
VGEIADSFGLGTSFVVPLAAYLFIALFAVAARRGPTADSVAESPTAGSPIP